MAILTYNEVLEMPGLSNLMRWIDSHDRPAATLYDTDTGLLTVASIECRAGVAHEVADVIPATIQAARDLLGY